MEELTMVENDPQMSVAPKKSATPIMFGLLEPLPEYSDDGLTNTGGATQQPGGQVWDTDYDS